MTMSITPGHVDVSLCDHVSGQGYCFPLCCAHKLLNLNKFNNISKLRLQCKYINYNEMSMMLTFNYLTVSVLAILINRRRQKLPSIF
jgi:hypothetical protein